MFISGFDKQTEGYTSGRPLQKLFQKLNNNHPSKHEIYNSSKTREISRHKSL